MPYQIKGNSVVKKSTGKVVGHSNNPKKYMQTLNAVEHGWKPHGQKTPTHPIKMSVTKH